MGRRRTQKFVIVDTNAALSAFELLKDEPADREEFHTIRKGWAWLLFMYCHRRRVTTLSLHELQYQTTTLLPNDDSDISRMMRVILWVAQDVLLPRWKFGRLNGYENATKAQADDAYLAAAQEHGFPLVTNEDWIATGIRDPPKKDSLRRRSQEAGVPVFTPREYVLAQKFDPGWQASLFFQRWERLRGRGFEAKGGVPIPPKM